ncbi:ImuA family protein [Pleomorphomonas sp. PLEO]|uniref:ImuA family protein n=1 Tax=Pleomorphomonas sp. PLEO TaxID=3239306 RepID=UPI00351EEED1
MLRRQIAQLERARGRGDGRAEAPAAAEEVAGVPVHDIAPVARRLTPAAVFRNGRAANVWAGPETTAVPFGHPEVDAATGGLRRGALHDISPAGAPDMAAATGFALALAGRLLSSAGRGGLWLWVRAEMAGREAGEPYGPGLTAFGLDPSCLVAVTARDTADVLRAAEEGLAARAFAAVLIEPFGDDRHLDLTACRRLSLIADGSRSTGILLRTGGVPGATSAVTRWRVAAAPSCGGRHPGNPVFSADLARNRLGPVGAWMMEWRIDEQSFRAPRIGSKAEGSGSLAVPLSGRLAAASGDRSSHPARSGAVVPFRGA